MPTIKTFAEAQEALRPFYDNTRTPYTLEVPCKLLKYLGDPQERLRVIHVAGTSGKTSTAYYSAALLKESGKRVGLSVSPHVETLNERLQIDGQPVPEAEYCQVLSEFMELINQSGIKPSYFELLVAMAFWEFARRGVDYAVIEVGLGGLLDGTNVVERADKVCVITDIGLDHTEILGDTIEAIATQKAGIIKPGNTVFMCKQDEAALEVVRQTAAKQGAELYIIPRGSAIPFDYLPPFQQRNIGLAASAVNFILERDEQTSLTDAAIEAASQLVVPARLQSMHVQGKTLLIDGSHNRQKMQALLQGVATLYPGQAPAVLVSFMAGNAERWQGGLEELSGVASHLIFTTFHGEQDLPKSSITADEFVRYCDAHGITEYTVESDPAKAYGLLLARSEPLLLVTGSFYLLNHIRPLIKEDV